MRTKNIATGCLALAIVTMTSCLWGKPKWMKDALAQVDNVANMVRTQSEGWRAELDNLAKNLPPEVQSTIRVEAQNLASRSVIEVSDNFKCNTDFVRGRIVQDLERLEAMIKGDKVDPKLPHFCSNSPSTIDFKLSRDRRQTVVCSGYDFDSRDGKGEPLGYVALDQKGDEKFKIPEASIVRSTHYRIELKLDSADLDEKLFREGVTKIVPEFDGKRWRQGEIGVIRWESGTKEITHAAGGMDYDIPHKHGHGDKDLDTNDGKPARYDITFTTWKTDTQVLANITGYVAEKDGDHTVFEGTSPAQVVYNAEPGYRIKSVTPIGQSKLEGHATNHDQKTANFAAHQSAQRMTAEIDGKDDDAPRCSVTLTPIKVVLEALPPY